MNKVARLFGLALVLLAALPAAADTLAAIKQRGVLRVGCEGTYSPFCYQDEQGNLVGFDVDIAKAVAVKMGLKPEFTPSKWEGILAALDSSRFDAVFNQVTVSDERKKAYEFSQPYTYSGLQILVRKDKAKDIKGPDDLAGKKVGVLLGTNHEQYLREHTPKADVRTYEDDASRNQDLLVGRIDAILNDRLIIGAVEKIYGGQIVSTGGLLSETRQAAAVKKGNTELVAAIDQALAALTADGTMKAISEKWFSRDVTHP
ncbi:MAG TPA: cystine ABC transporter substrate-binding protein [Magnetospirillaceae bacterium]|nr:cystine ABC transporter substrate-binding protein [Magnetospirillaceae bacterium]